MCWSPTTGATWWPCSISSGQLNTTATRKAPPTCADMSRPTTAGRSPHSQSSTRLPNGCAPDACFRRPLPQAREAGFPGKQPAPGPSLGSLAARGRDEHVAVLLADGDPHDALLERVIEDGLHQRLGGFRPLQRARIPPVRSEVDQLYRRLGELTYPRVDAPQLDALTQAAQRHLHLPHARQVLGAVDVPQLVHVLDALQLGLPAADQPQNVGPVAPAQGRGRRLQQPGADFRLPVIRQAGMLLQPVAELGDDLPRGQDAGPAGAEVVVQLAAAAAVAGLGLTTLFFRAIAKAVAVVVRFPHF